MISTVFNKGAKSTYSMNIHGVAADGSETDLMEKHLDLKFGKDTYRITKSALAESPVAKYDSQFRLLMLISGISIVISAISIILVIVSMYGE